MRYAIFTDIHANLEALEAVLAKIDEIAEKEPIDQIWFLGDLVGYGPDPNECILKLRERTDVIIAGNHDWAAVGRIDLEDFSPAARISAEWTAEQLTEEHRAFLTNLPERLEIGECTLVHGSPYGPLWEYLTSEALAERSFQYFSCRYCLVGHTHVPIIFIQPDTIANTPTLPLTNTEEHAMLSQANGSEHHPDNKSADDAGAHDETVKMGATHPLAQQAALSVQARAENALSAYKDPNSGLAVTEQEANAIIEQKLSADSAPPAEDRLEEQAASETEDAPAEVTDADDDSTVIATRSEESDATAAASATEQTEQEPDEQVSSTDTQEASITALEMTASAQEESAGELVSASQEEATGGSAQEDEETTDEFTLIELEDFAGNDDAFDLMQPMGINDPMQFFDDVNALDAIVTPEDEIEEAEERLNGEIEELLTLLGLTESMIQVTNELIVPPEGHWDAPPDYRAIINPGGVGQPRDGDSRAAFMIYDTERGFEFYRVPYDIEKTQEKIIKAGLPHYLAMRLAYGR